MLFRSRVRTEAKHVVVCVLRSTIEGATERTRQKLSPAIVGKGTLALVVPNSPATFVKKFFVVAAGSLWKGREVKHFGSIVEGGIFPDGRVRSKSSAGVPRALSLEKTGRLYSGLKGDQ